MYVRKFKVYNQLFLDRYYKYIRNKNENQSQTKIILWKYKKQTNMNKTL